MRRLLRAAVAAAVAVMFCGHGFAQEYPTHTITLIVPYPAGGGADAVGRLIEVYVAVAGGRTDYEPPARLSTTTCWPSAPASFSATTRAMASTPPPGG